ncbi:MAG: hypothetical protein AB4063_15730 [Crocosphaera sp.]
MTWITISIVIAGCLSGFFAGSSYQSTGGSLSSMIGGVIVGILAGVSQAEVITTKQIAEIGKLFFLFQVALFVTYILSNRLRVEGKLDWFLGKKK